MNFKVNIFKQIMKNDIIKTIYKGRRNFMKIGLVLEGGAMRGLFTAGVLDIFLDNNVEVTDVVGVSAGTLFGVNYVSKQRGRALRYNLKYINDKRYMNVKSWLKTGNLINKDFTYYKLPFQLDVFDNKTFKESPINFFATVTNIETGEAEFVKIKDAYKQMETLRATSALPFISEIIEVGDKKYLDGGISNSIPIDFFEKQDFDKVIVILTRPITYRKEKTTGIQYKLFYKKYPKLVEKLENRYKEYNDTVDKIVELEKEGKLFVIRPSENITIKRLEKDIEKLQKVYDLGLKDGNNIIEDLKQYLEK
jgi:rssA protein